MARKKPPQASTASLLVEILTEELPPKALRSLGEAFAQALKADLGGQGLLEPESALSVFATPRRIAAHISLVRTRSPDKPTEFTGPSVKIGLDADGKPTQALMGFARKQGVDVQKLERAQSPKGEVFVYRTVASGIDLRATLDVMVEAALKKLPVPKMMRWGSGDTAFVRPVHGLLMMHGSRIIAGHVLGAESSNWTLGHRFLSNGKITIKHADTYARQMRSQGHVIVSFEERQEDIVKQLHKAASGAELVTENGLLNEVTALVEWPVVYAGAFSPEFLAVPEECLSLSMQQHQRYVPLRDPKTGKLVQRFLFVSNVAAKNADDIVHGNERVLRARLSDAKFFFDQDCKTRLETRVPRLANVVYHNKLGTQLERVERIQLLAVHIAQQIGADHDLAERAARLSKADLVTEMVGEFPELQGIMGGYYATHDGERKEVADAISTHYRPRFSGDELPDSGIGVAVALADKIDTLAGLFSIGEQPTGDRDPFALRRAALGVIRIVVENQVPLKLSNAIDAAFTTFKSRGQTDLAGFFMERMRHYFLERGYTANEVEAVLSVGGLQPASLVPKQLEAVRAFTRLPEAESLAAANKRVANLLKQAEAKGESFSDTRVDELKEPAEQALHEAIQAASRRATPLLKQGDFTGYLKTFAVLKAPVDAFFDSVMVMVDDRGLRQNRLALLADLRTQMNRIADISKLAT